MKPKKQIEHRQVKAFLLLLTLGTLLVVMMTCILILVSLKRMML